ncbi:TonB-dependent receptor domain-containing protein [Rubrivirga sp.]|uniref:TonB-dependent receptor domain-containing protein n=1 Tax=Rubrivirga sp. TaxID=1885344 RepID=UPI003C70C14E
MRLLLRAAEPLTRLLRYSLVLLAALVGLAAAPSAQTGTLTGLVTDNVTDDPIPAATVRLEGTILGVSTDVEGRYTIPRVEPGEYTLAVSFVGYRTYRTAVTVEPGETTVEDVEVEVDRTGLDEVIVTGQGRGVEARRLSTTVESISARDIAEIPAAQIEDILQANLPNSQVRFSSGQPGTATLFRSRGVTSANQSTTPVIYIDGVRVDNLNTGAALGLGTGGAQSSALADIPIENIDRIEFVKGGAASTLYGSDAGNGVLQIFTKKGVSGGSTLLLETQLGFNTATRDFLRFQETADILFESGAVTGYRLSGNGGAQGLTYSFSGRALADDGFRPRNENRRFDLRSSLSAVINPTVTYTGTFGYGSNAFQRDYNANANFSQFQNLEAGGFGQLSDLSRSDIDSIRSNVRSIVDLSNVTTDVRRFQTSQQLQFNLLPSLFARVVGGIDYRVNEDQQVVTNEYQIAGGFAPAGTSDQGSISRFQRRSFGLTLDANVSHSAEIGAFSFLTNVGGQLFRSDDDQTQITTTDVTEGSLTINNSADQTAIDQILEVANYGVYVAENVGFRNTLFFDIGLRLDGNSAFGEDVGTVLYPRIGVAYTPSEEAFFQRIVPSSLLSLKLRANYGEAGNFPTPFAQVRTLAVNPFLGVPTFTFGAAGDSELRPERISTTEFGADIGLANNRIMVEASYYDAVTNDALFNAPFAPSTGQANQLRNIGEVRNRGFEISTSAQLVETQNLSVRLSGSFNTLENEVVSNGGTPEFNVGGFTFLGTFVDEGQPVGYLRGNRPVFADDGSIGVASEATTLGDTEISAGGLLVENLAALGSPVPSAFGNLSLSARYRGLTFLVSSDYQLGAQGVNTDEVLRYFGETNRVAALIGDDGARLRQGFIDGDPEILAEIAALDGQAIELTQGLVPARSVTLSALGVPGYNFFNLAGAWVEDTDFLKIRQISASYEVPSSVVGRLASGLVEGLRIQAAVTNPFNFATSNFDPEITGANANSQNGVNVGGFGFGTESPARRFLLTLGARF